MRTSVVLGALVLLSALFVAANAVPEDVSAIMEEVERVLKEEAPKPTCMEKFMTSRKACIRDHMCSTDDCKSKTDSCIAKAYKRFKICKFPPKSPMPKPPPPSCEKLCKMLYDHCKKDNKGSCGVKYNNCITNNCS